MFSYITNHIIRIHVSVFLQGILIAAVFCPLNNYGLKFSFVFRLIKNIFEIGILWTKYNQEIKKTEQKIIFFI